MAERQRVLLIEDNPGDVRLIQEMLSEGQEALFHLDCWHDAHIGDTTIGISNRPDSVAQC